MVIILRRIMTATNPNMLRGVIFLLLLVLTRAQSDVHFLDDGNYSSFIAAHPLTFVQFYDEASGASRNMAEDYERFARSAKKEDFKNTKLSVAKVQAKSGVQLLADLKIRKFPTLSLLVSGNAIEYTGQRKALIMLSWVRMIVDLEIKSITEDEFQKLVGRSFFVLVRAANRQQLQELSISQKLTQVPYYSIPGDAFQLTFYLQNSKLEYKGRISIAQFSGWINRKKVAVVALSAQPIIRQLFQNEKQLPTYLLLKNPDFPSDKFETLRSFCQLHDQQLLCGYAEPSHAIYAGLLRFFKTEDKENSILCYLDYGIKRGYLFERPLTLTEASLGSFLKSAAAGEAEPFYDEVRSKAEKMQYRHVLKLTDDNFNQSIAENAYIFVQYYSPYCRYCIQFSPQYESLAAQLIAKNSSFVVAAADLTEQTAIKQQVNANGYPTFRFYVRGQELDYKNEVNPESMLQYMTTVANSKLKTIARKADLPRPGVGIFGVEEDHPLRLLPFVHSRFPVYRVLQNATLRVEVLDKGFSSMAGEGDLRIIANWLEEMAEPAIVAIGEHPKKLTKAFAVKNRLLVMVKRGQSDDYQAGYTTLEAFCQLHFEYVCALASRQDPQYENFNEWLDAENTQSSLLVFINTQNLERHVYSGQLAKLSESSILKFVSEARAKTAGPQRDDEIPEFQLGGKREEGGQYQSPDQEL